MSTWINKRTEKSWFQSLCEGVLKFGNIPKHVAIIMDGNRRFAVKKKYERSVGHLLGFNKISETLEWCAGLEITEVTLYAFSLENFKRSKEEVDCLMQLAREKFSAFLKERDLVNTHGLCVRIIGNISYLPNDLQVLLSKVIHFTRNNNKVFLNVCCAYTSQEEMTQSMIKMRNGVADGIIIPSDIDEALFEKGLYTAHCSEPDILIRTSGEVRLSDFLLWQTSYCMLFFTQVLWPEFTKWHLYSFIILFQLNSQHIIKSRQERDKRRTLQRHSSDVNVTRKLIKQFPSVLIDNHDVDDLDSMIRTLQIDEDDFITDSYLKDSTSTKSLEGLADGCSNFESAFLSAESNLVPLLETQETITNSTAVNGPNTDFAKLLEAVISCRKQRCERFIEKLEKDYENYIDSIWESEKDEVSNENSDNSQIANGSEKLDTHTCNGDHSKRLLCDEQVSNISLNEEIKYADKKDYGDKFTTNGLQMRNGYRKNGHVLNGSLKYRGKENGNYDLDLKLSEKVGVVS